MKMSKPYFSHDIATRGDIKIKSLIYKYKWEGYGIFWAVVEFLHENNLEENQIEILADDLKIEISLLKNILYDTDLFYVENNKFVSNRINQNLKLQEEKSKKAKKSAGQRWGKDNPPPPKNDEESPKDETIPSEITAEEIIPIFNKEFKKSQIVSNENKSKMEEITSTNKLSIEDWQTIFSNAQRGWDYPDGNKKPSLKKILDEWDSFHRGDCNLAPKKKDLAEEQKKQNELEKDKADVSDKKSALEYIKKYATVDMINNDPKAAEFRDKWGITKEESFKIIGGEE